MRRQRLISGALVGAGSLLLLAAAFTSGAVASAEPGSGFGSFTLTASAPAVQLREESASPCFTTKAAANGCEGVIPESVAELRNGPIGHGLAAVAWPGVVAAGAGSLLITVGGSNVPPQATILNDPVRADAYTNVGKPTVTYDMPGTTMTATALPDRVSAEAAIAQSVTLPVGTFGRTTSQSSTVLRGTLLAVATAHSDVANLTIAGIVHVDSVVSDATATTDGVRATASGHTAATGITVARIPVTVDDRGVTVAGSSTSLQSAQATVNSALSKAGMSIALGAPNGKPVGPAAAYSAQSLVFVFTNATGFTTSVVLGGANVSVDATPAFGVSGPKGAAGQPSAAGSALPPHQGGQVSPVTSPGLSSLPGNLAQPLVPGIRLDSVTLPPQRGTPVRLVLLTLSGAALIMAGLRGLPARVLRAAPIECLVKESP